MSSIESHSQALYARIFNILMQAPTTLRGFEVSKKAGVNIDAEQALGNAFLEGLREFPNLRINLRRRRAIKTQSTIIEGAKYRVCIDPLDGASHYNQRGHTSGLSHASCVTVLRQNGNISKFSDIVAGGIVELRTGDWWTANRSTLEDHKGKKHFQVLVNNKPFKTSTHTKLDLRTMTIFASMHNEEDRERIQHAFGKNYGMIRTHGSVASEIAYVASGQAIACISSGQSHYSQGAGFTLMEGANGVTLNLNGQKIENDNFDLKLKTPFLFAANMSIAEQILELFHRP